MGIKWEIIGIANSIWCARVRLTTGYSPKWQFWWKDDIIFWYILMDFHSQIHFDLVLLNVNSSLPSGPFDKYEFLVSKRSWWLAQGDTLGVERDLFRRCLDTLLYSTFLHRRVHVFPRIWDYCTVRHGYGSIPIDTFLVGWTSIYQLFWGSPGVPGFWHTATL